MNLSEKQGLFTRDLGRLLRFIHEIPEYDAFFTLGRGYASDAANKADKGIKGSLHTKRMAIDLNLFVDDEYQTGFHPVWGILGRYWVRLNPDENRWGGNFRSKDYNHFSRRHGGKQ